MKHMQIFASFIVVLILISCSINVQAQFATINPNEYNDFRCAGWLIDFPDTLTIYKQGDTIPKGVDYSTVFRNDAGKYVVLNWDWADGIFCLNPIYLTKKLKIHFNSNLIIFKIGGVRVKYFYRETNGQTFLIKSNPNDHRKAKGKRCVMI